MENKKEILDLSGRPLGLRAMKKRRQLMDSAAKLLENISLRDIRVVDIAREVGASPATFYQYFKDVDAVVLELAEEASAQMPMLTKMFEGEWQGDAGLEKARKIVDAFIDYWDQYGAVLRVRNLAADQGDSKFLSVRSKASTPMLMAMVDQLNTHAAQGTKIDSMSAAVAMGAVLDRLSAYHKDLAALGIKPKTS